MTKEEAQQEIARLTDLVRDHNKLYHQYAQPVISDYDFVRAFPLKAWALAESFWPGPLTLFLPKKDIIPNIVTAGLHRV